MVSVDFGKEVVDYTMAAEDILKRVSEDLKAFVGAKIDELRVEISQNATSINKRIDALESAMNESINFVEETTKKEIEEIKAKTQRDYSEFKETIRLIDRDLETCNEGLEELEQYSRRNNIRIMGIPEKKGEDPEEEVMKVVGKVKATIQKGDIDRAHRVGKYQEGTARPIIVKFISHHSKMEVITQRKTLRQLNTKIFIVEDLTQTRRTLLKKVRENDNIKKVWTEDGRIKAQTKRGKVVRINTDVDFINLS